MSELGANVFGQESKSLKRYLGDPFEYVVTAYDDANEACPVFPGAQKRLHWSVEDPSRAEGKDVEWLAVFRRVSDASSGPVSRESW